MPRLERIEDLHKLQARLQEESETRTETGTTIIVGMGTCGISAGAGEVMQVIQDELKAREIDARVTTVSCIGMCSKEPLVDIQERDGPRITYGNVAPKMVSRIIDQHLVQGCEVEESSGG